MLLVFYLGGKKPSNQVVLGCLMHGTERCD